MASAVTVIVSVRRASSRPRSSSGLKRRSIENHADPGTALNPGAGARLTAHHEHRAAGLVALDREARALTEQLVRERW